MASSIVAAERTTGTGRLPGAPRILLPGPRRGQRTVRSIDAFAPACGLDAESVRNWEAGRRDPGPVRACLRACLRAIANDPVGVPEAYAGVSAPR